MTPYEMLQDPSRHRVKLRAFLNSLALAPIRTCRTLHSCAFCTLAIRDGDQYRDRGLDRRAHEKCFQSARMVAAS